MALFQQIHNTTAMMIQHKSNQENGNFPYGTKLYYHQQIMQGIILTITVTKLIPRNTHWIVSTNDIARA